MLFTVEPQNLTIGQLGLDSAFVLPDDRLGVVVSLKGSVQARVLGRALGPAGTSVAELDDFVAVLIGVSDNYLTLGVLRSDTKISRRVVARVVFSP